MTKNRLPTSPPAGSSAQMLGSDEFARKVQPLYRQLWLVAAAQVGNRSDVEDIVQDAIVIAFRKRGDFQPGTNFAAWLAAIVKLCAANHRRKQAGRKTYTSDPQDLDRTADPPAIAPPVAAVSGEILAEQTDFDDETMRALQELTADARGCLLLRAVHQLSYAEISEVLGIPEGTAMSHVHRSRATLRRVLGPCLDSAREERSKP